MQRLGARNAAQKGRDKPGHLAMRALLWLNIAYKGAVRQNRNLLLNIASKVKRQEYAKHLQSMDFRPATIPQASARNCAFALT
jgi:hypothetical protein